MDRKDSNGNNDEPAFELALNGAQALVMVVDDEPRNSSLYSCSLGMAGFRTRIAGDGATALSQVAQEPPDLILLDVMMPGMDGLEVCRRLKGDEATRGIPVLLLTALHDPQDKVRGLDAGADDFLCKPIERAELLARVRTHLRIKNLRDEVIQSREELVRQNRRLRSLERMRRDLTDMLVHDLKSPLTAIHLGLELIEHTAETLTPAQLTARLRGVSGSASWLQTLVANILDVSRLEEVELSLRLLKTPIGDLLIEVADKFAAMAEAQSLRLEVIDPGPLPPAIIDRSLISRVLDNLVVNAIKHGDDPETIDLRAEAIDGELVVTVADRGPGVPPDRRDKIFDKFSSQPTDGSRFSSHGIGLAFARMAVEAHGCRIWMEPRAGGGSEFRFTVPVATARKTSTTGTEVRSASLRRR